MVGVQTTTQSSRMEQLTAGRKQGFRGLMGANRYILISSLTAVVGSFLYGTDQGVLSNLLTGENFASKFPDVYTNPVLKGWVVSCLQLGAWLGALINGPLADWISRKYSLMVAAFNQLFTLGSALCGAAQNIVYLFAGRIIAGIAVGQISHVVPLYLAEISPSEFRGALVSFQQLGITAGIMVSYWLCYGTSFIGGQACDGDSDAQFGGSVFNPYTDVPDGGCTGQKALAWRLPLILQVIPSTFLLIAAPFLPYSPRWLMSQGREDECRRTISRLRALPEEHAIVETEWLEIKAAVLFDQRTAVELHPGRRGFSLGIAKVGIYAPTIFGSLGLNSTTTSLLATGVLGVVDFVFTFPAIFFVDRWGRRIFLMAGAIGMMISHFVVAGIVGHYDGNFKVPGGAAAGWIGVVFIYIFGANFSYSWGPVAWLLASEIFSPGHRSQAVSIIISCNYMMNFVIGQVTPNMLDKLKFGTYIFFGAFCLLMFLWVLLFVPETRYKTLEEMDVVFGDNSGAVDQERMRTIMAEVGLDQDREDEGKSVGGKVHIEDNCLDPEK
ncbi:D-xylose-proton symporter (hexose transporter) [Phlyctema vagabunda]|uniref:D-xylose-proton symporter (Hexose transporter) n=1 Tax=Phlyctema vagabunda TaxID=108571 RepID=A0ABR4PQB0_9HELO